MWSFVTGGKSRRETTLAQTVFEGVSAADSNDDTDVPLLYVQCRTKQEKIAWLRSEMGQKVLKTRPVLHEYYHNGYIFQIIDNPHWKTRLEDWLTLPTHEEETGERQGAVKVPYGLSLPKTEEEKLLERTTWLHPPCENPPLPTVFGEYFEMYKTSPEDYLMPLENRLQLLTDGFTVLRQVVPLDVVEHAEQAVANAAAKADVDTLEKLGLAKELIYANYQGTRVRDADGRPMGGKDGDERGQSKKKSSFFSWSSSSSSSSATKAEAFAAPRYERKVTDIPQDQFFLSATTNELPVLAMYYASRVHIMLEYILHGEAALTSPFRVATGAGQVAYRFSQPQPAPNGHVDRKLGGSSWHIDGLQNGAYGSFSFLVGFPLSDQQDLYAGNLCLHPGSHYHLQPWLENYAKHSAAYAVSDVSGRLTTSTAAAAGSQRHLLSPAQREEEAARLAGRRQLARHADKPVLDEPVQVQLSPGDVVVALHKVAHFGGPNYHSRDVRKMIYFRVSHRQHASLRYDALSEGQLWIEYEGLHDLL